MILPQEIEANFIIPMIRKELAKELLLMNISQKKVAEILGISNAAVCHYSKDKRAKSGIVFGDEICRMIEESAKRMADKNPAPSKRSTISAHSSGKPRICAESIKALTNHATAARGAV